MAQHGPPDSADKQLPADSSTQVLPLPHTAHFLLYPEVPALGAPCWGQRPSWLWETWGCGKLQE